MRLDGKVAVITGGARGLGEAFAKALLEKGEKVCIVDILDLGKTTKESLAATYGEERVMFVHCDVSSEEQTQGLFSDVKKKFGNFHVFVNNAGIGSIPSLEKCVEVNLTAVIRCSLKAKELMSKTNGGEGGVIINIGSIVGLDPLPLIPIYTATKAGVIAFGRSYGAMLESSFAEEGVRLNVLCPSTVKTELAKYSDQSPILRQQMETEGGWCPIENVAEALIMLAEDDALCGAVMRVNALRRELVYPENLRDKYNKFH